MTNKRPRLIVFGREPRPGRVKTRLIPALGARAAADLYDRLLIHSLRSVSALEDAEKELWYDAGDEQPLRCRALAELYGLSLHRQCGGDLGDRMYRAIAASPPSPENPVVLIGSDCPEYSAEYLGEALDALEGSDAVMGPARDGGYVLMGLNRLDQRLFESISWGSGKVMASTRAVLRQLGWRWQELRPLRDVDRPSDLAHPAVTTLLPAGGLPAREAEDCAP